MDQMSQKSENVWDVVLDSIMYNSSARLEINNYTREEKEEYHEFGKYVLLGNVTEKGILRFFMD